MAWSTGRIVDRRVWAPGLVSIRVEVDTDPFEPGQFFNVGLELEGERVFRAYSVASPPGQALEFYLTEVSGGRLTPALCRRELGEIVEVERHPQGFFTLKYVPDAPVLWLVATGTGLGPFMSILRADEVWRRFPTVVLVHGVREQSQLGYHDVLGHLVDQRAGRLRYVPVVSRDPGASGVVQGRVTRALVQGALERQAGVELSPDQAHVMLCGNPAMIEEFAELLAARGMRRHRQRKPGHVTTEKYW